MVRRIAWDAIRTSIAMLIDVDVVKPMMKLLKKLADYEDTGMTPEQVIEMQMDWVAMKAASETYRKEKAERPDVYGDGYDPDGNLIYDMWDCPRCGVSYEIDYDHYDYCPNCGQKIDWSEFKEWKD